jgi:hypothetical protein
LYRPIKAFLDVLPIFQPAAQGAIPILFAATSKSVQSGEYYGPNGFQNMRGKAPVKETSSALSYSAEHAATLWQISEDATNCKFTLP